MTKNISESLRVAKLVNAEPNLCWENAVKVMLEQSESSEVRSIVVPELRVIETTP